jgi:plasmid stabilization system protein ParE
LKRVEILRPAEVEFRDVVRDYRERDPRVAERFISEVRRILELLESFPDVGGPAPGVVDRDVRRMPIHKFPYSVVFLGCQIAYRSSHSHTNGDAQGTSWIACIERSPPKR